MTSINTNIAAFFAQANLRTSQSMSTNSIGRLSSGDAIIRAADDVAGLSVGTVLATNVNSLKTALANTKQANSLLQIADGGLDNITTILQRQKSLAVSATSGTLSSDERSFLNQEFQNLADEINRLVANTKFNQVSLLDGSIFDAAHIQTNTTVIAAAAAGGGTIPIFNGTIAELKPGVLDAEVDAIFNTIAPANGATTSGFNTAGVVNNAAFVGSLENDLVVEYLSTDSVKISLVVGDTTYTGVHNTAGTAAVVMNGLKSDGITSNGSLQLNLSTMSVGDETQAALFSQRLNSVLDQVTFFQERDVVGDITGYISGSTFFFRSDDHSDVRVSDIRVKAATATQTGLIEFDIDGVTYSNTIVAGGAIAAAADAIVMMQSGYDVNTASYRLEATIASALTIDNGANAAALESALKAAFRVGTGDTALAFQTGASVSDTIEVQIKGLNTKSLYGGLNLNTLTVAGAQQASTQLDKAMTQVVSIRADVGALQSRFDFAAANLESAIQNQDAARSLFLDADISKESTAFAKSQVLMQASISVLAQANLLPQNLLKLIG